MEDVHRASTTWRDPDGREWEATFELAQAAEVPDANGSGDELVCVGIELRSWTPGYTDGGDEFVEQPPAAALTAQLLRAFPFRGVLRAARRDEGEKLRSAAEQWPEGGWPAHREWLLAQAQAFLDGRDESAGGRPPTYDATHFAQVAEVYIEAARAGQHPTAAVREHFTVSRSAAAKWVARCRDMGLLPPTERGKPRAVDPEGKEQG